MNWTLILQQVQNISFCVDVRFLLTDCEWKAQAGNPCAASFDWSCSGICKSVERMEEVHQRCGEGDEAIWHTSFWNISLSVVKYVNVWSNGWFRWQLHLPDFCLSMPRDSWYMIKLITAHMDSRVRKYDANSLVPSFISWSVVHKSN